MTQKSDARPVVVWIVGFACLAGLVSPGASTFTAQTPRRVISLVPAVTEMLFAVGAGPQVVAVSSFDDYPPQVRDLERVGALLDPDLERILAIRPDLVVVYASQVDLQQQLHRAGIATYKYRHAGLPDVTQTIRDLGALVGHGPEAAGVVDQIDGHLAGIRRRVAGTPRPRTMVVFGRDPGTLRGIYASGGVGFVHDMLDVAGGENIFADVRRQSVQATGELILTRRPDVILELSATPLAPEEDARELAVWRAMAAVPAVKSGRVVRINDPRTVIPGPRVAEGVELLARALHPEAFK